MKNSKIKYITFFKTEHEDYAIIEREFNYNGIILKIEEKVSYTAGIWELEEYSNQNSGFLKDIFKIVNRLSEEEEIDKRDDIRELMEQLQYDNENAPILSSNMKKIKIYSKNGDLYLGIKYEYEFQKKKGKSVKRKVVKHKLSNLKNDEALLAYCIEELGKNNIGELIEDPKVCVFSINTYQKFMDRYIYTDYSDIDMDDCNENSEEDDIDDHKDFDIPEEFMIAKNIGKIVIYDFNDGDTYSTDNIRKQAVIFYKDGSVKNVSVEEAITLSYYKYGLKNYKKRNWKEKFNSILESEKLSKIGIEETSGENLEIDFQKYREAAQKAKRNKKINSKKKSKNKKFKIKSLVKKISFRLMLPLISVITIATGIVGGVHLSKRKNNDRINSNNSRELFDENSYNDSNEIEEPSVKPDYSNYTFNQLLDKTVSNKPRYSFMSAIKGYLTYYNETLRNTYSEGTTINISHNFEEAVSMYLAYNNLNSEQIYQIFGNTKLDADKLIENFNRAIKQDSMLHNIQLNDYSKDKLIKDSNIKTYYKKYDEIFKNINNARSTSLKRSYLEKFYSMVREDLPDMSKNDYTNVEGYKVLIKEFCNSASNIKLDVKNSLTIKEKEYIDDISRNVIYKKFKNICTKQNARVLSSTVSSEYDEEDINIPSYEDLENKMIEKLENSNAYYVSEAARNITKYKAFTENTILKEEKTSSKESTTVNNTTLNNNSTNNEMKTPEKNNNIKVEAQIEQSGELSNQSKTVQIKEKSEPLKTTKEDKVSKIEEPDNDRSRDIVESDKHEDIDTEIDSIIEEANKKLEEELNNWGIFEDDKNNYKNENDTEESNDYVENAVDESVQNDLGIYNGNDVVDFIDPDSIDDVFVNNQENSIDIDADKVDENGNLNDQFEDLTTDPNVPSTDLSNEELVDQIISAMENSDQYTDESMTQNLIK